ncbi:uncharacterized protein SRS1_14412 [Sporisorium reilianum f. sp. reilianum]|uniref:J domain-containing protein n=1 Tax=Sporisorium reilianum f. sp. reilianum TaxID=72559 RepID=A0A2N8UG04_9BASI|nr:uncharacterized protein SRS1_14412 [Sporisorium reilianum f. sp. reilianum]
MKADLLQLGSLLTWWWLPSVGSQLLLGALYSLHLLHVPAPSAHRTRAQHLQLARAAVVIGTLVYQLHQAATRAAPSYYELLALPLDVDAEGVRRSFRALARRYHPDKVGPDGEAVFIALRRAHDVLSEPVRRFAYDRFGAAVAEWKDCESARDYVRRGLAGLVAFYTVNPAMYAAVGYMNGTKNALSFWRLACLFALLAAELQLLIAPEHPAWLSLLLPSATIHDVRNVAHALFVNYFFASLQLSAALDVLEYGEHGAPARDGKSRAVLVERQMQAVRARAQVLDAAAEAVRARMVQALAVELRPLRVGKVEEERVFDKIDAVLLCRSLVQQHPASAAAVGEKVKEEEEEELVVKVKEEPVEGAVTEPETTVKAEEATSTVQDPISTVQIKTEAMVNEQVVEPATVHPVDTQPGSLPDASPAASALSPQIETAEQDALSASNHSATATPQTSVTAAFASTASTSNDDTSAPAHAQSPLASAVPESS